MSHAIIIPIYCENRNTINLCNELQNFGAEHIVVVNDGLNPKSEYFNELTSIGCHLVHLKNNNGKGASLKAGIKYAHDNLYNITGYITCDADGQHTANDVMKISRMLDLRNGSLILGKRDYKSLKCRLIYESETDCPLHISRLLRAKAARTLKQDCEVFLHFCMTR